MLPKLFDTFPLIPSHLAPRYGTKMEYFRMHREHRNKYRGLRFWSNCVSYLALALFLLAGLTGMLSNFCKVYFISLFITVQQHSD